MKMKGKSLGGKSCQVYVRIANLEEVAVTADFLYHVSSMKQPVNCLFCDVAEH